MHDAEERSYLEAREMYLSAWEALEVRRHEFEEAARERARRSRRPWHWLIAILSVALLVLALQVQHCTWQLSRSKARAAFNAEKAAHAERAAQRARQAVTQLAAMVQEKSEEVKTVP
jgi:hypothetical protein